MPEIKVQEFFKTEFPNFAVYNLYRMVGSYVDGLKPSQRKIVHTVMKRNITSPKKVSQLASDASSETQYLHGEINLQGVIVNMVQDFAGTNNMNLLYPESSFGNRCFPQAAAARYIYTRKNDIFDKIFHKEDIDLLPKQEFEGDPIEPKYFLPTLPLILINGSEGIGSGWAQKILPRNPKDVKKEILRYLDGKETRSIKPWFNGFKGEVRFVEGNTWELCGVLEQKNLTTFEVTELPPNVSLDKYTSQLIKLEDQGKIVSFTDYSDSGTNSFKFEIKTKRDFSKNKSHDQLMRALYLVKRVTENFTCMDENNEVREFLNDVQILHDYCDLRLNYYDTRKQKIIHEKQYLVDTLTNKQRFIADIVEEQLKIKNLKKSEVIEYLKKNNYDQRDSSYNYLLNMPIYNISKDQYQKLQLEIQNVQKELKVIESKTPKDIWKEDMKKI